MARTFPYIMGRKSRSAAAGRGAVGENPRCFRQSANCPGELNRHKVLHEQNMSLSISDVKNMKELPIHVRTGLLTMGCTGQDAFVRQ